MSRYATYGKKSIFHPTPAMEAAVANRTPKGFSGRANEYRCPLGRSVGRGWLLMLRSHLDSLDLNAWHTLSWFSEYDNLLVNLAVARAICMNQSNANDPDALYLVEVVDVRSVLCYSSTEKQYNVRMPAPEDDSATNYEYYPESLNGSALWTWQTMFNDIWGDLPAAAGTAPTLPSGVTLAGTPQNIRLLGQNSWDSYHDILEQYGMTTAFNPKAGTFSIVEIGDTAQDLKETELRNRLMYDYDPLEDINLANAVATVRVMFPKRYKYYGVEKDTVRTGNWEMAPYYSVDTATGIAGASAGTVKTVWDDMEALYNTSDALTNSADCAAKAANIANAYKNKLYPTGEERYKKIYSGVSIKVLPGSLVKEVVWKHHNDSEGLVTEIINRPEHEIPTSRSNAGVTSNRTAIGFSEEVVPAYLPQDLGTRTHPLYPHLSQVVQVYDSSGTQGQTVSPTSSGLHKGRVKRFANGTVSTLDDCWIRIVTDHDNQTGDIDVTDGDYFVGRLSGLETDSADIRPVYLVQYGSKLSIWQFTLNAPMNAGEATADKIAIGGADTGDDITVKDPAGLWTRALIEAKGLCIEFEGSYYVLECQSTAGWVQFELNADMADNQSNAASVTDFGGSQQDVQSPGSTVTIHDGTGLFTRAVDGCVGLAFYDAVDNQYIAVECETLAGWVQFELNADMADNQSNAATVTDYGGSQQDIFNPGNVTIHDGTGLFTAAADGCVGLAFYDAVDNQYIAVECETLAGWVQFELTEDMGNTADNQSNDATVTDYGGSQQDIFTPGNEVDIHDGTGLFTNDETRALIGCKGLAFYDVVDGQYIAVECQTIAGWIEFTLSADLGASAVCTLDDFGGSQQDIFAPGALGLVVHDAQGLFPAAVEGCKGRAEYDAIENHYDVVECQTKAGWIRFELTATMLLGTAPCTVGVTDFGGSQNDVFDPGRTTAVWDADNNFPNALSGAIGQAIYDAVDDKYYIVSCNQMCTRLRALVDQPGVLATAGTFNVDTLLVGSAVPFGQLPAGYVNADSHLTVNNRYEFVLDDDAEVDLEYNGSTWDCVQGTCPD